VTGNAVVTSRGGQSHGGVAIKVDGTVQLQLSPNNVGILESLSASIKPVGLVSYTKDVIGPGKFPDGKTSVPFEFKLAASGPRPLVETYHGVNICVQYMLSVEVQRGSIFGQTLQETTEFIVEVPQDKQQLALPASTRANFTLTHQSVKKCKGAPPKGLAFSVRGVIAATSLCVTRPLEGALTVDSSSHPIKSISLQLVRVETVSMSMDSRQVKEASEVQGTQLAVGDVARGIEIPIYMVLPRLFSAPCMAWPFFQLDFELNLLVEFESGYVAMEAWPLKILRLT